MTIHKATVKPRIFANHERFLDSLKKQTHINAIKFIINNMEQKLPCFFSCGKFYFIDTYAIDFLGYLDISARPSCKPNEYHPIHYFRIHALDFISPQNTPSSASIVYPAPA